MQKVMCKPLTVLRSENNFDILFAGIKKSLYMASSLVVEGSSSLEISTRLTKM